MNEADEKIREQAEFESIDDCIGQARERVRPPELSGEK